MDTINHKICGMCVHFKYGQYCYRYPPAVVAYKLTAKGDAAWRSAYAPVKVDTMACGEYKEIE